MTQTARPASDIATTGWTTTPLYSKVNDASDGTSIRSNNGATNVAEVKLGSSTDPTVHTGHIVYIRAQATGSSSGERCQGYLKQGASQITTGWNYFTVSRTQITTYSYTLTEAEAANISDYTDLRIAFQCTNPGGSEYLTIYDVWLEVPDAIVVVTADPAVGRARGRGTAAGDIAPEPLVTTSYTIDATIDPYNQSGPVGPFVDPNTGYMYALFRHSSAVEMWRSTDDGQTWAEQDAANHPTGVAGTLQGYSAQQVGTDIHVAHMHASLYLLYSKFSTSSNTWTLTDQTIYGPYTDTSSEYSVQVLVASDGTLIVAASGENGLGYTGREPIVYHFKTTGAWTTNIIWNAPDADVPSPQFTIGEGDVIHGFTKPESTIRVEHASLTLEQVKSSTVPSNAITVSGAITDPIGAANWFHGSRAIYIDDGGTERVYALMVGEPGGSDNVYPYTLWMVSVADGSGQTATQVTSASVKESESQYNRGCVGFAADVSEKKIYVLYANRDNEDIYLCTYNVATSTWTRDELFLECEANVMAANVYERDGYVWLGVVWDDAYSGGYGTTKFAEYQLHAATAIQTGAAQGRASGRASSVATNATTPTGAAQGYARARATADSTVIGGAQTITADPAQGRARGRASSVGDIFLHTSAAVGRASGRSTIASYCIVTAEPPAPAGGEPDHVRDNTAEGGSDGTTVVAGSGGNTGGVSGDYFPDLSNGAGTITFDNDHPAHGSLAYKFVHAATICWIGWPGLSSGNTYYFRGYAWWAAASGYVEHLIGFYEGTTLVARLRMNASGVFQWLDSTGTTMGNTYTPTPGSMLRIEAKVYSAGGGSAEARIYDSGGNLLATLTGSGPTGNGALTNIRFGASVVSSSGTLAIWWDSIGVSNTDWLGAYGEGGPGGRATGAKGWASAYGDIVTGNLITADPAVGRARARAAAVATNATTPTGVAVGRASGRAQAVASPVFAIATAQGRARGRATADSTIVGGVQTITADPAVGRASGRSTIVSSCIVTAGSGSPAPAQFRNDSHVIDSLTLSKPSGLQVGDMMLAIVWAQQYTYDNPFPTFTGPGQGWTEIFNDQLGLPAEAEMWWGGAMGVYWKRAAADDPASWTWTCDYYDNVGGGIVAYYDMPASEELDGWNANMMADDTSPWTLGLTTASPNTLVVSMIAPNWGNNYGHPAGYTERVDDGYLRVADFVEATPGNHTLDDTVPGRIWGYAARGFKAGGGITGGGGQGRAKGRATADATTFTPAQTVTGTAVGYARARATAAVSPVLVPSTASGRATGRAAAVSQRLAVIPAVGWARGRGTAVGPASFTHLVSAQGRARAFAQASGTVGEVVIVTGTAAGRSRGRATATGAALVFAAAQGRALARATSTSIPLPLGAATGRARARSTTSASVITTGVAQSRARGRAAAVSSPVIALAIAQGRARARATAIPASITTTAAAHGRARARSSVMWLEIGTVTGTGSGWARARARAVAASITTTAAAHGRARGRAAAAIAPFTHTNAARGRARGRSSVMWLEVGFVTGQAIARAHGHATAAAQPFTHSLAATGRARTRATSIPTITIIATATGWAKTRSATVAQPFLHTVVTQGRARGRSVCVGFVSITAPTVRATAHGWQQGEGDLLLVPVYIPDLYLTGALAARVDHLTGVQDGTLQKTGKHAPTVSLTGEK